MAVAGDGVGVTDRVANVTISRWFKRLSDQAFQKWAFLKMLESKKRCFYGQSGGEMRWPVVYRYADVEAWVDGQPGGFQRNTFTFDAYLPWRGYRSNEAWSIKEELENGGEFGLVKLFKNREAFVKKGLYKKMGGEWFKDGAATGNEHTFHGAETLFSGIGAQTDANRLTTSFTSTYAGTSCSYTSLKSNAVAGTDEEYGVWSGIGVNTNRNPGTGIRAWEDYADEYIRTGVIEASYGDAQEDRTDMILLSKTSYEQLLNILDDKERIPFKRGEDVGMVKAGFTNFVEIDGVQVGWDFGMEAHTTDANSDVVHGYGFNFDEMGLYMLNKSALWDSKSGFSLDYASQRVLYWCLGNLRFESPRHVLKFADTGAT
jgi:hypothetical protein